MRAIDLPAVIDKTSMKKTFIYQAVKDGEFPAPKKIGRRSIWDEAAVDAWLQAKFGLQSAAPVEGAHQ